MAYNKDIVAYLMTRERLRNSDTTVNQVIGSH
jgi:hypothetical protein